MNIVILTIILPYPLDSGGAQAQYNMIDSLRRKHNITVVFPENGMNRMSAMHELEKCWPEVDFRPYRYVNQLANPLFLFSKVRRAFKKNFFKNNDRFMVEWMLTPYGYSVDEKFTGFMNNIIAEKCADVVQIEFYPYLNYVHKLPENVHKVFVHHEIRYIRNRRLLADIKLLAKEVDYMNRMRQQEIDDLNCYDMVVTLTNVDRIELEKSGVKVPIVVSPASVNAKVMDYSGWNGRVIFLGGYGHTPNKEGIEWFLKRVAPLVDWNGCGVISFDIIGAGWPVDIETMQVNVKVNRLGFVENLADVAKGCIMVVPILSGSGMRMKILEAAAMGLPVVTTSVGVEGLSFEGGKACLISDTPEDFAMAINKIMSCEELRKDITNNARAVYEEKYSIDATVNRRNEVYNMLVSKSEIRLNSL